MGWPPALRELKELLYEVYLAAGAPSLDEIAEDIADDNGLDGAPSRDTVNRVISDASMPPSQADVVAVASVLARRAVWGVPDLAGRVRELWVQARMAQGAGRPIGELHDDVRLVLDGGLGIHPALDTDDARDRFGILPAYIPRDHDARLRTVVDAAKAGRSGIAVLVGGSSTGKTRALWEAVRELPDGWRLWHPLTPTAPDAALAALPDIAPRTVVWLNEAQHYLAPDPLGEQLAAGLRKLLTDPSRAPVLVLGTLWPDHWDTLTTHDRHPGARALLSGHKIDVPKAFAPADLAALNATDAADPRLTQAAQHADDAQVTQYLAGVPYLTDRYRAAEGATLAFIHAAMDARRLGAGLHIPLDWLAGAARGYLTDTEYHALDADWLLQALAWVTAPCNGIPGILTPVNTSGPRNERTRRRPERSPQGPHYLLADYLDQHGRRHRAETIPPIDFWTAAAHHAHPADLTALGNAAWDRGLYRDAAQLHKNATSHGNPYAAAIFVRSLHALHPTDQHPAQWAATYATVDDPRAVAWLLMELRLVGAGEQAAALAERAAAHTALNHPRGVARLLQELRKAGADEQATVLLARNPAAHTALDDPEAVARLLMELRLAGADEQATVLLARNPAAHATLNDPSAVATVSEVLRKAGAHEQAAALAERAAAHTALDRPHAVARLLEVLRKAGADEQATVLLARNPAAHTTLNDPSAVAWLLHELQVAEADEQAATLAERAATHTALDPPLGVARLLEVLRKAGAAEQATVLLARNPAAHTTLNDSRGVARLLKELRKAGADEQATVLLAREPAAHVALGDPRGVATLLEVLREAGAQEQVATLAERAATHDHPRTAATLLRALRQAGAHEQAAALAERAAAHVAPDDPDAVARLLQELRMAEAHEQAAVLAERAAAHAALDDPDAVAALLQELREAGANKQATVLLTRDPAAHAALNHVRAAVVWLLDELRMAGAHEQVTALTERLPAAGKFALFIDLRGNRQQFRFGREPDRTAAPPWTWHDMH
ncbi:hypothetical protein AB0G64_36750 [Streptomyces longwoodensis]|uniref:hypothetical protein n=1 Tax=Streptomyces longwoodensis TaxID=68231 RepID=UPI003404E89A